MIPTIFLVRKQILLRFIKVLRYGKSCHLHQSDEVSKRYLLETCVLACSKYLREHVFISYVSPLRLVLPPPPRSPVPRPYPSSLLIIFPKLFYFFYLFFFLSRGDDANWLTRVGMSLKHRIAVRENFSINRIFLQILYLNYKPALFLSCLVACSELNRWLMNEQMLRSNE